MTTLHDRLTTLAARAEQTGGPPPGDLWDTGRRLHRRRRIGTMAVVGVCGLLLAGLGWVDHREQRAVAPASGEAPLAMPDHVHDVSRWLPGTDAEPFGPLVAIKRAERGEWFGSPLDWVGVSATTGEYRFLDLPDAAGDGYDATLSPTGRYVAYWIGGDVAEPRPGEPDPVVGFAVYDLVQAEVLLRETRESDEGLMVDNLFWLDRHTVLAPTLRQTWAKGLGYVGTDEQVLRRDIRRPQSGRWPAREVDATGHGWAVAWSRPTRARAADAPRRVVRLRGETRVPPLADPSGVRFATLQTTTGRPRTAGVLAVTEVRPGADVARFARVAGGRRYDHLFGWRDEHTVMARRWLPEPGPAAAPNMGMFAVDIRTGEEELVATLDTEASFAADLLDLPTVERPAPPTPLNPWLKVAGGTLVVASCGGALLVWRRRVGP